jgi:hypothetical protein
VSAGCVCWVCLLGVSAGCVCLVYLLGVSAPCAFCLVSTGCLKISEEQKQSESSLKEHGGLAQVFERWHTLRNHIETTTITLTTFTHPSQRQATSAILSSFDKRRSTQLSTIHAVAHLLNPRHISYNPFRRVLRSGSGSGSEITSRNDIFTFLERMGSPEAYRQYHDFRNMQGPFIPENHVWQWKELSRLALRIFHTPGLPLVVFNYIMLIFSREFCPLGAFLLR